MRSTRATSLVGGLGSRIDFTATFHPCRSSRSGNWKTKLKGVFSGYRDFVRESALLQCSVNALAEMVCAMVNTKKVTSVDLSFYYNKSRSLKCRAFCPFKIAFCEMSTSGT